MYHDKHSTATVKHGDRRVMIKACFAPTGSGKHVDLETIMNSTLYQNIIGKYMRLSGQQLKLGHGTGL